MFCEKCGTQIEDGAKFCPACGHTTENAGGNASESKMSSTTDSVTKAAGATVDSFKELADAYKVNMDAKKAQRAAKKAQDAANLQQATSGLVEPDEKVLGKLGNGYLVNALFGRARNVNATLTDKRVYFKGEMYIGSTLKNMTKTTQSQIIDLEDVTGSGFIYSTLSLISLFVFIITALLGLLLVIISFFPSYDEEIVLLLSLIPFSFSAISLIVFLVKFILSRSVFFFIQYAGGNISVDAKIIGLPDVADFHMQLRRAKEALKK